jgi:hypothetical protein
VTPVRVAPFRANVSSWTLLVALMLLAGCGNDRTGDAQAPKETPPPSRPVPAEWFVDHARETGLDFVHFNGMSGEFYDSEIFAPGVGLFDYDNDGDLDAYIVQGQMLGGKTIDAAVVPPKGPLPLKGRLYRNDLEMNSDGTRTPLHFTDVTEASGLDVRAYGMGVATGDFNNDGCVDLYATNLGMNQLFRNNCDGTFTDVSKQSGTNDRSWSVSAAFVDFDRDGWLDLFVGNYLSYSIEADQPCYGLAGQPDYCAPIVYRAQRSGLYHNNRDGTFTDVTAKALVGGDFGPALGVVTADFNGDGWIDIYVANDGQPNQLWINQHDSTFKNTALLSGAALNADGRATASMGVDAGDFDNDGDEDLFYTNLSGEGDTLLVNAGSGTFEDEARRRGLHLPSLPHTGFGAAWADFDNDGWLDILAVNGAVRIIEALAAAKDPVPFHERNQLFRNLGDGRFDDVTDQAGAAFRLSEVSRGAAFGDVDIDGDVDVLIGNNNGPVRLLINNVGSDNHWLGVRLVGQQAPRDMVGARVGVIRQTGPPLWRRARADGSYASANDPRVLIGLGASAAAPTVRVVWPSGRVEQWSEVPIDRYTTLKEGSGK